MINMEEAEPSETLVTTYENTWRFNLNMDVAGFSETLAPIYEMCRVLTGRQRHQVSAER
jgi:hypothetical protein